jgi:uncharacterized protein
MADPLPTTALDAMLRAASGDKLPPVDSWNPPYCGDIGMAIKADGTWFYQGSPIGRKPMVRLFSRILRRDADGQYFLVTPIEKVDVAVADAPFLAVEMEVSGQGPSQRLTFRTNIDDIVIVGSTHPLRFVLEPSSGGLKPYVRVRGRLDALVTRAVYYDLMELAVSNDSGIDGATDGAHDGPNAQLGLWSAGTWFPLAAA